MNEDCGLCNCEKQTASCCFNQNDCDCGHNHENTKNKKTIIVLLIAFISAALSYVFFKIELYTNTVYAILDVGWISVILCGAPIYKQAFLALKKKKIVTSLLISIALTASLVMGVFSVFSPGFHSHENYFFVAAEISFLMALGEVIEEFTASKSRSAIKELISLNPQKATLKTEKGYTEKPVGDIEIDDIIMVRPDEKIPLDGIVVDGESSVNQSSLTGESLPRDIVVGDEVYSSTINLTRPVEIRVSTKSHQTVLSKLIDYYKNAVKNKAPIARAADKIASKLVPIAMVVAFLVFAITAGSLNLTEGLARGIAVLVVFCPCGLVLATPTAISATIGNASRRGILIKNGNSLEVLSKVDTVAFDKTGTITTGEIEVDKIESLSMHKDTLLHYAASAEMQSEHPIAKAIIAFYGKKPSSPKNTTIKSGVGVEALVNGKKVELLKVKEAQKRFDNCEQLINNFESGKTIIAIVIDDKLEGALSLKDSIKESSYKTIKSLKNMNYHTVLITGDNLSAAKHTAEELDFDSYYYNKLPIEKAEIILQLRKDGKRVLMVGDGVNDAPALAKSDTSMSMGSIGSQAAIEAGEISLLNDDISKIPSFMRLAKRGVKTIYINIFISLFINAVTVALSAAGLLSAVWGALLHNVSSVLVAINSALILTKKN